MTDLSILNEQNLRILLGELSDLWFHLISHLGINASNYFMYQWAGPVRCPLPSIIKLFYLIHLNQAGVKYFIGNLADTHTSWR